MSVIQGKLEGRQGRGRSLRRWVEVIIHFVAGVAQNGEIKVARRRPSPAENGSQHICQDVMMGAMDASSYREGMFFKLGHF